MSRLKREILEELRKFGHLNAEDLFLKCKEDGIKTSFASVYRVLSSLEEDGAIRRLCFPGFKDVYDKTTQEHEHIICTGCGKIKDFSIDDFKNYLNEKTGVNITSYSLCVEYLCPDCANTKHENINLGVK